MLRRGTRVHGPLGFSSAQLQCSKPRWVRPNLVKFQSMTRTQDGRPGDQMPS